MALTWQMIGASTVMYLYRRAMLSIAVTSDSPPGTLGTLLHQHSCVANRASLNAPLLFITPPPTGKWSIAMIVSVCVCLSVLDHIFGTTGLIFTKTCVRVARSFSGGVVIRYAELWMKSCLLISQGCSTSLPSWNAVHTQNAALGLAINCVQQCQLQANERTGLLRSGAWSKFLGGNTGGGVCGGLWLLCSVLKRDSKNSICNNSAADLWKNCGFGGKSTKIGTDHAEYTRIGLSYSAKPDF